MKDGSKTFGFSVMYLSHWISIPLVFQLRPVGCRYVARSSAPFPDGAGGSPGLSCSVWRVGAKVGGSMSDSDDDVLLAYLRNQELECAEDYLRRGRHLAKVPIERLNERWVVAFKKWVQHTRIREREPSDSRVERNDIEAELLIRQMKAPFDLVKNEIRELKAAATAVVAEFQRDPARWAKVEEELLEDFAEFLVDLNRKCHN